MPRFKIRPARPDDLSGLLALEASSFDSDRLSARSFRRLIAAPTAVCRVADIDGAIAGYSLLFFRKTARAARLYSIAVGRDHRGAGLGEALLRDAESQVRARGKGALRLEVRKRNRAAVRLYERSGYEPIATLPGYYGDGSDGLRYERQLSGGRSRTPRDGKRLSAYTNRRSTAGDSRRPSARRLKGRGPDLPRMTKSPPIRQVGRRPAGASPDRDR
jgi:[ribosomal protein S18]-alanine N-acetyltransferase